MQMHESKANTTRSGSSSAQNQHHHHHKLNKSNNNNNSNHNNNNNNKLPKNQSSDNNQPTPSKKSRSNRNSNRDRQPDNDAKPASVSMSNSSSYSFIEDDHIDDQESINVGNLIIDLESDLEKEKIESEQANNSVIDSNTKSVGSIANAPSSTSSATSLSPASSSLFATSSSSGANNNNNNKATSSTTIAESSNNNKIGANKSNQKTTNKHSAINSNTNANTTNNNGHSTTTTSTRTVFKSSADERGELKMKITRETKPAKNEFNSKPVTSPSQKSPTCSSSNNNNNNNNNHHTSHLNNLEDSCPIGDSTSSRPTQSSSSSISSTKECGTSTSVGTITEPECLGPCEPGTSVTLEGIVWQETEGGILVVNVTWRGKTYVGALLDCTRHDWAPPRLCDSPASDIDSKNSKGVRAKRIVTRSNGIGLDEKNLLQTTGKLRNGKGRRIPPTNDPASCSGSKKQPRDSSTEKVSTNENQTAQSEGTAAPVTGGAPGPNTNTDTNSENPYILMNIDTTQSNDQQNKPADQTTTTTTGNIVTDKAGPNSPMLIGCSEPNCSKKYRNMNGLLYHQTHAHGDNNDTNSAQDDNCSSSTKDKSSKVSPDEMQKESATTPEEADVDNNEVRTPSPSSSPADKDGFTEKQSNGQKRQRTPSPPCSVKMSKTFVNDQQQQQQQQPQMPSGFYEDPYSTKQESSSSSTTPSLSRTSVVKNPDSERRHSSSSNFKPLPNAPDMMARRSPGASQRQPDFPSHGGSSSSSSLSSSNLSLNQQQQPHHHHHHHHSSTSKQSSSGSKQSNNPPPLPATTEEGMKPSGTSTGPPPAPHQANCYFNSAFLANSFNPYGLPPYFPRHMPFDPMAPPTPTSNAAFLSRFMNNMRAPPPPDSPSRLLSPASMPKNLPFPAFKLEPGLIPPPPVPTSLANAQLPNMSPLPPPPPPPSLMGAGSPHLRMPSQGDPMMPPTSQPPYLPPVGGINPALGLPGMPNPLVGPLGGPPQLPSLVDDSLAKQFPPRRFN